MSHILRERVGFFFQALAGMGLLARVYYLQYQCASRYQKLSDQNRRVIRLIPEERRMICDRIGHPIATEIPRIVPLLRLVSPKKILPDFWTKLGSFFALSQDELAHIKQRFFYPKTSGQYPIDLKKELAWPEALSFAETFAMHPYVFLESISTRYYPMGPEMAHTLGYVIGTIPKGQNGLELYWDALCTSLPIQEEIEISAKRRFVRVLEKRIPQKSSPLQVSLDSSLQRFLYQELSHHRAGAGVVIHIPTGEIRACVSYPSFDPNLFVRGIDWETWNRIIQQPDHPLLNRALAGLYPPGSVIKMAVALTALQQGIITSKTKVFCSGSMPLGERHFHCMSRSGHGLLDLHQALAYSCDIFFYELSKKLCFESLQVTLKALGLGTKPIPDFPGMKAGILPSPMMKRRLLKTRWTLGDQLMSVIGQGITLASPLQLACMIASLASGKAVKPTLHVHQESSFEPLPFRKEHLQWMREAMVSVMQYGTASQACQGLFPIAGKTGTSQVKAMTKLQRQKKYDPQEIAWRERDHAVFCGYAPRNQPEYAICILIEHGGTGGKTAAPIAARILEEACRLPSRDHRSPQHRQSSYKSCKRLQGLPWIS